MLVLIPRPKFKKPIWRIFMDILLGILAVLGIVILIGVILFFGYIAFKVVKSLRKFKKESKKILSDQELEIETDEQEKKDKELDELIKSFGEKRKNTKPKVYVMNVNGVIKYETEPKSNYHTMIKMLQKTLDDNPAGLMIRINSPGGTVAATQEIYDLMESIRHNGTKIVALMEDIAASGGLYVAMGADKIVANSGTITGSAGVIMHGVNYGDLLKKYGLKFTTIKAGKLKDIMSPTREMTPEEKELLEKMALDTQEQFLSCISKRRKLKRENMTEISDARILTGSQALKLKLVDHIGGYQMAVTVMEKLLKLKDEEYYNEINLKAAQTPIEKLLGKSFIKANIPFLNKVDPIMEEITLQGPLWLMPRI